METANGHSSRRRLPNHTRCAASDVQAKERKHHLYGFGALEGGISTQSSICDCQTRSDRFRESCRQGRRRARCPLRLVIEKKAAHVPSVGATSRAIWTRAAISGVIGSRCVITIPML